MCITFDTLHDVSSVALVLTTQNFFNMCYLGQQYLIHQGTLSLLGVTKEFVVGSLVARMFLYLQLIVSQTPSPPSSHTCTLISLAAEYLVLLSLQSHEFDSSSSEDSGEDEHRQDLLTPHRPMVSRSKEHMY